MPGSRDRRFPGGESGSFPGRNSGSFLLVVREVGKESPATGVDPVGVERQPRHVGHRHVVPVGRPVLPVKSGGYHNAKKVSQR